MIGVSEVGEAFIFAAVLANIYNNKLDLHFFGNQSLYVYADALSRENIAAQLRKTCEIGRNFNKDSIAFNGADDTGDGLSDMKAADIFLPCAQQLLVGQV